MFFIIKFGQQRVLIFLITCDFVVVKKQNLKYSYTQVFKLFIFVSIFTLFLYIPIWFYESYYNFKLLIYLLIFTLRFFNSD